MAAGLRAWNMRCEHHGVIQLGEELGWTVRGGRRAGIWVAQRDGEAHIADTARELLGLIQKDKH